MKLESTGMRRRELELRSCRRSSRPGVRVPKELEVTGSRKSTTSRFYVVNSFVAEAEVKAKERHNCQRMTGDHVPGGTRLDWPGGIAPDNVCFVTPEQRGRNSNNVRRL